jgi:hypothetical protein
MADANELRRRRTTKLAEEENIVLTCMPVTPSK